MRHAALVLLFAAAACGGSAKSRESTPAHGKTLADWCGEHGVRESECYICNPTFIPQPPPGADIREVATAGEDVPSLEAHVAPGKVTVFDFWAPWCGPCKNVEGHLNATMGLRDDVAVRKLNVLDWGTPLAKRHLAKVAKLPYVVVYGRDGKLVRAIVGFDLAALDAAIAEGARR